MPGYQLSSSDLKSVPSKYICKQCRFVLREPMQTPCAHFYCRSCLEDLKSGDETYKCRDDSDEFSLSEVFYDRWVWNEVRDLIVHCLYEHRGCEWKGEITFLEDHSSRCDFVEIPCLFETCQTKVLKLRLAEHLENECSQRSVWCEHCKEQMPFAELEDHSSRCDFEITCFFGTCQTKVLKSRFAEHLENECSQRSVWCEYCKGEMPFAKLEDHVAKDCQWFPIDCTLCGKKGILRGKLKEHQDAEFGDCEGTKADCPFGILGRQAREELRRIKRRSHEQTLVSYHLALLFRLVLGRYSLTEDVTALDQLRSKVDQLLSHATAMLRENGNIQEEVKNLERILLLFEANCYTEEQKQEIDRTALNAVVAENMYLRERNAWLERRSDSLERQLALRNVTLANLEENISQQEFRRYDGQLLWKITEFARKRSEAVSGQLESLSSPFFYTSTCGYKVCGQIYLNGNYTGQGTHISLYFVIMHGENDATLRWPFRQKVTFIMLDQDHVKPVIEAFIPDSNSSAFQRPEGGANIGSGCPRFCSLTELNNHAYVRDDTMLLKIIVDTTDL